LALERDYLKLNDVVAALERLVELMDLVLAGHQKRVSYLARALAGELGLNEDAADGVYVSARLHDIGELNLPADLLNKPGDLDEEEISLIRRHPRTGYDILEKINFGQPVAEIVFQHHEKMDGSGYPNGLKGEEILMEARILCVAEVVEAISSQRPYRQALGLTAALDEISKKKDVKYDPAVVDGCLRLFREKQFTFS